MPIHSHELPAKIAALNDLRVDELTELLADFDTLWTGLRWGNDIAYQAEIATCIEQQLGESQLSLEHCMRMAEVFVQHGDYQKAQTYYEKAKAQLQPTDNNHDHIMARIKLGQGICLRELHRTEKYVETLALLQQAYELGVLTQNNNCIVAALREIGLLHLTNGHYRAAYETFFLAYEQRGYDEASVGAARMPLLNYQALCQYRLGNIKDALKIFNDVQILYCQHFDFETHIYRPEFLCQDYASHLMHYAMALTANKEYESAHALLMKALEMRLQLTGQQRNRVAETQLALAKASEGLGNQPETLFRLREAKEIYEKLPVPDQDAIKKIDAEITRVRNQFYFPRPSEFCKTLGLFAVTAVSTAVLATTVYFSQNNSR